MPTTATNRITFPASNVTRSDALLPTVLYADAVATAAGIQNASTLGAYSRDGKRLLAPIGRNPYHANHLLIQTLDIAFSKHYPVTLSPDMVWLTTAQGFARHIKSEDTLRDRLKRGNGKIILTVRRDDFVRGFAGNDWESAIAEFSAQIQSHVGTQTHGLLVQQFSTTGFVEKAAAEITLMDALQHYFDYLMLNICGIPEITLEGTPEDWQQLRDAAARWGEYDLEWWIPHLLPVLDQFVAASSGSVDTAFWESFYHLGNLCGGPYIQGHVVNLFPYLVTAVPAPEQLEYDIERFQKEGLPHADAVEKAHQVFPWGNQQTRNKYLGRQAADWKREHRGVHIADFPSSLSVAPFTWQRLYECFPMEFIAGFVGIGQEESTLSLRPEIGWAVCYRP